MRLWCILDIEKVLTVKENKFFVGSEELTQSQLINLQQEVLFFKESALWKVVTNTLREQAQKMMFEKSVSFQDMTNGKMILYTVNVQNKILDSISKVDRVN